MSNALVGIDPMRSAPHAEYSLDRSTQDHLGEELRAVYGGFKSLPFPKKLRVLLAQFEGTVLASGEQLDPAFRDGLVAALPNLRAFALSLVHDGDRAADLVQDTLMRAWDKRASFQPGTNLNAWLFTILRNCFYSEYRRRKYDVEDCDGKHAAMLKTSPEQGDKLHVQDLQKALLRLAPDQREALLLVGAEGVSYEEAATICGCPVGTIKSRVNRARIRLAELMGYNGGDLEADRVIQAALVNSPERV
jgi:RNA polymerase sigma-70 factor (ECF subfamily)